MKKIFSLFLILVSTLNIGAYAAPNVNDKKSSNALLNQKKLQKKHNDSGNGLGWKISSCLATAYGLGLTFYHFWPREAGRVQNAGSNQLNQSGNLSSCNQGMIPRLNPVERFEGLPENPDINNIKVVITGDNGRYPQGIVDEGLWNDLLGYNRGYEKRTAIVDASNRSGLGGGGVDGMIFGKMGGRARPYISANLEPYKDSRGENMRDGYTGQPVRIETGGAIIHSSFDIADGYDNIPYVIQAVSPMIHNRSDFTKLRSAYYNAVRLAIACGCKRLLVPALGMNIFFQPDGTVDPTVLGKESADVALAAISDARRDMGNEDIEIIFTDYGPHRHPFYQRLSELGVSQILAPAQL